MPSESSAPLQITVFLPAWFVPAWQCQVLQNLLEAEFVEPRFVVFTRPPVQRLVDNIAALSQAPFYLYEALDRALFSRKPSTADALKKVDLGFLKDFIREMPVEGCGKRYFPFPADLAEFQKQAHDVFVDFTEGMLENSPLARLPRYGVWSLRHEDYRQYRGHPPFFWEMFHHAAVSGTTVQVLRGGMPLPGRKPDRRVIYRSYAKTHPYSLFLSRNEAYWKSTPFLSRRLIELYRGGWEALASLETYREEAPAALVKNTVPTPLQVARFLGRITERFIAEKREKKGRQYQYRLAFKNRSLTFTEHNPAGFSMITPPASEFWADPFLFAWQGTHYLFFENYRYAEGKGVIAYMALDAEGRYSTPQIALARDYHLSYPQIFTYENEIYMLPETSQNRTIEVYKAMTFPRRWVLHKVLMTHVNAQDVTLFENNGQFWLFANLVVAGGSVNDELFLFYADSPFGPWTPHPKNPVVSDVSCARPAGNLFYHRGVLIRPSQDCSRRYGYAVNFNRVEVLNQTDYRESLLYRLTPDGFENYKGLHTYNANEAFEVIDIARYVKV